MKKTSSQYTFFIVCLIIVAAVPAAFINFPPGDSWTQAWAVQQWLDGKFILNDWSSTLALPQQIIGWIVEFGRTTVDFGSLAVVTAIVTILALALTAKLPSRLYPQWTSLGSWAPLLVMTALAAPFTLKVAAGFMTDAYYLLFTVSALWLLIGATVGPGGETSRGWVRLWIGFAAFATLAALQRTHGLTLLFITLVWIIFAKIVGNKKSDPRFEGWRGWFPVIVCAVGFILSMAIMSDPNLRPARSVEVQQEVINFWMGKTIPLPGMAIDRIKLIFGILMHFGFAMIPVTVVVWLSKGLTAKCKEDKVSILTPWLLIGEIVLGILFIALALKHEYFPYLGNSITIEGFGPRTDTIALTAGHHMSLAYRLLLSLIGLFGAASLIWLLSKSIKIFKIDWRAPSTLIGLLGLAHLGLVFLNPNFFDRYLIPIIPFAYIWLAPFLKDVQAKQQKIGWAIVAVLLIWSVWGTADYLDWTKSKWDLAAQVRSDGYNANTMIAGYEVDGYFNFSNEKYREPNNIYQSPEVREIDLPWWVSKLNLPITPAFVIIENGSNILDTPWQGSGPLVESNDRMLCLHTTIYMYQPLMWNTMTFAE
jgi:hypothetical protein